jgi:two-component system NtrC family sensor kinase
MQIFVWDESFVTGLDFVDEQHHRLVEIINQVGGVLNDSSKARSPELQTIFKELSNYAQRHFAEEEALMAAGCLDARYVVWHKKQHQDFIDQLLSMWRSRDALVNPAEILHGFLASWLTAHILGVDQGMARQVARVKSGESAAAAHAIENKPMTGTTDALRSAMEDLYRVLALQQADLAQANLSLKEKVATMVGDLVSANTRHLRDQEDRRLLLRKVDELQSQLMQLEKMASIGELAAGVAHEINNPVGFVNSNLGTLKTYVEKLLNLVEAYKAGTVTDTRQQEADLSFLRADIADLVKESQDGLERIKKIIANLQNFSHVDEAEWQDADLNAGLESTLNVVWNALKYKAAVVRELGQLPLVRCIPAQINQVLLNLLVNAVQAIEQHGTITLRSGVDGEWVWLEVADTGSGMPPEVQQRIFDAFFTTKPVGKGTGLGLSLSHEIVTRHGGRFVVSSETGKGSVFRMVLPIGGPVTPDQSL